MANDENRILFDSCKARLVATGLETKNQDAIICPLCWEEMCLSSFSVEHVVPESVGGRMVTLTCKKCNNDQGGQLDAHLANFQKTKDALKGHGSLKTVMHINGKRMVANLDRKDGKMNFTVVAKASNPKDVAAIQEDFEKGLVKEANFTMSYEYATNNFNTAVLRAAYLALFDRFGYEYAKHDVIQAVRRRICDLTLAQPDLSCLVIELRGADLPGDRSHYIVRCKVAGIDCFLVIIQVQKATRTYLGAYLPNVSQPLADFDALMEKCRAENNGKEIRIPKDSFLD